MRIKFTIVLLLLNAAAFFYIYHLESQDEPKAPFDNAIANALPNALAIDRIQLDIRDGDNTRQRILERERDSWEITSPFRWPANDNSVQRILTQLQFLDVETVIPLKDIERAGQDLADFGLDNPQIVLSYEGSGEKTELKIGSPTTMGNRLYILAPNGKEVYVVSRELLESLDVSLENLRSPRIFSIPIFEINSLRIQGGEAGEQRIVIEKSGHSWQFVTPLAVPADKEMVISTLGMLSASKAFSLIPVDKVDKARMGLATPRMRITLSGNDRRESLVLGGRVPNAKDEEVPLRYAMLETASADGTVFTVNSTNFDWLVNATDELRERRFFRFDPASVTAIHITQGDGQLTLQKLEKRDSKADDAWQVIVKGKDGSLNTVAADADHIDKLLTRLQNLKAEAFISDAPSPANLKAYGFEPPNATIKLDNGRTMSLLLGAVEEESARLLYAKTAQQGYVYAVPSVILGHVSTNPLTYRSRVLEQQPDAAIVKSMVLTDLQNNQVLLDQSIDPDSQTWPTLLMNESEKRREAILGMVDAVKLFEVKNYLYTEFKEVAAAPWRYKLEAEVILPGGESSRVIKLTFFFSFRIEANRQIGGSPDFKTTYTLKQSMIDDLFVLTFEAEPPELPASGEAVLKADPQKIPDATPKGGPSAGTVNPPTPAANESSPKK